MPINVDVLSWHYLVVALTLQQVTRPAVDEPAVCQPQCHCTSGVGVLSLSATQVLPIPSPVPLSGIEQLSLLLTSPQIPAVIPAPLEFTAPSGSYLTAFIYNLIGECSKHKSLLHWISRVSQLDRGVS